MATPRTHDECCNDQAPAVVAARPLPRAYTPWLRVLVPAGTLLLLAALGETAFRVVPNAYQQLVPMGGAGAWHVPGQTYVYRGAPLGKRQPPDVAPNVVRWNREGWHDVDHERVKPPHTARVLVIGDSYVEGVQVRLEELYHRRLEGLLQTHGGAVEVIAMESSGWGQEQELKALITAGLGYQPDLVLVEFLPGNDVRNNHPELERLATEQAYSSSLARRAFIWTLDRGWLFPAFLFHRTDLALRRMRGQQDPVDNDVYRPVPRSHPELWSRAWGRTAELLDDLRAAAARAGAEFVVIVFTSWMEIEASVSGRHAASSDMDPRLPARRLMELCAARGLACLDLAPRFARLPAKERQRLHLEGDGHWSRYGHDQAARETVAYLTNETPIWQRVRQRAAASGGSH